MPLLFHSGAIFSYTSLQLMLWAAFWVVALLWVAVHHARSKRPSHIRLLHILSVVLALVLPAVTTLVQLDVGFSGAGIPTLFCLARSDGFVFYTVSLALSLAGAVTAAGLVIVAWLCIKVRIRKRRPYVTFCVRRIAALETQIAVSSSKSFCFSATFSLWS